MTELTDEQVFGPQKEMSDAQVFGDPMPDALQASVPEAFLDRVRAGQALTRITQAAMKEGGEGYGTPTPTGMEDETLNHLADMGWFHDPLKSKPNAVQFAAEAIALPTAKIFDALMRGVNAGIHGAGGAFGQIVEEFGGSQGTANRAKNEVINAGNWAMIEGGMGRFSRPAIVNDTPMGRVMDQTIGGLPRPEDFTSASKVLVGEEGGPVKAELLHGYNSHSGFTEFKPLDQVDDIHRYDGGGGVFGKVTYLSPNAKWISGEEGGLGIDSTVRVQADFKKLFTLRPDNAASLRRIVGDDAIGSGVKIAEALKEKGYDGIAVKGFEGMSPQSLVEFADRTGVDHDILQSQVAAFTPEKSLKVAGKVDLPERPSIDATDAELAKYREDFDKVLSQLKMEFPDHRAIAESNLRRMWQEDGIHPAEAVHDAQGDAFLKNEITAKQTEVKLDPVDEAVLTETGGKPGNLGAAATDPADIPLAVQPASPPGRLAAAWQSASETLFDIGRDAQMLISPMATGTRDSMAMAKDFANSMRRNRWDWSRIDDDIVKRFDPESRARMWGAADEEGTSIRLGESESMREHQGLATLEPAERALVDELQTRAQNAWVRAQDIGMVKGEALPSYTPRMVLNVGTAFADDKALPLNSIGQNLRIRTAQMLKRKHVTVEETERAAKDYVGMREALRGKSIEEINAVIDKVHVARDIRALPLATSKLEDAIAGRDLINNIKKYGERTGTDTVSEGAIPVGSETKWFTLDHPAFRSWRPQLKEIDGKMQAVKDSAGNTIFEQVPLYVHGDFEGPLRAVLSQKSGATYGALMSLKGKTMSLIMNSPMIHNAVEWGRAFPAAPMKVGTFKVYFEGNRAKKNVPLMHEAIDNGLVPIGHRFFNQDITSVMESPDLTPGRSLTAKVAGFVPGLFDPAAETAVRSAIDKAGDFWHNTLLWDRVGDLQMGLYKNFLDAGIERGADRQTSARVAAHLANRYAGALPKEAMSDGATKIANLLLFSRSFTLGNLGVMKDMLTGLPKDVLAQIERDTGFTPGAISQAGEFSGPEAAVKFATSMARRKAISTVALDVGLLVVGNSVMQSALNVMLGSNSLDQEAHGYVRRFRDYLNEGSQHPLSMLWPPNIAKISSTAENEPGLENRLRVGQTKDGTAIYARNPVGKIGEEFVGWPTSPLDMLRKKEGTIARPLLQILSNDAGFGRKIYDPEADTPAKYAGTVWAIAKHLAASQLPEGQITAFSDLVKGEGDKTLSELQLAGPLAGVTFRKGAPGGPAVGEMYHNKSAFEFRVQQAMPEIRRQILRGDIPGAQRAMTDIGMDAGYQSWTIKTSLNPATRLGAKAMRDFYRTASPEQRARMERFQQPSQP